uniref:DNA-directed RNA polymerase subunit alpha n=1 Tax=Lindsaea linearis TaxID=641179 RepID=A0A5B9RE90_9MONI|nr:RNA polymerase alpha subunit [Lindsaea linearis]QEG57379.1 RNA polymerase alpha subunit [Lindsaea linearis]
MCKDETSTPTRLIQWKRVESKRESKRLHYGRFVLSPFKIGQANTVGIAVRRALLGEIEGASITWVKFRGVIHEYSVITGIQETIHDILTNLKEIVPKAESNDIKEAFLSVTGPKVITAGDMSLPHSVKLIDESQYIATTTQPISVNTESKIEKDCGYRTEKLNDYGDGKFSVDAVSMPVRNVNYSVHPFVGCGKAMREMPFIEIRTNGSLTPDEALSKASKKLIDLSIPLSHIKCKEVPDFEENHNSFDSQINNANQSKREFFKNTFIDQPELPARASNCLKRAEIHTIADLLSYNRIDLLKLRSFGEKSVEQVSEALWKRFSTKLSNNKLDV